MKRNLKLLIALTSSFLGLTMALVSLALASEVAPPRTIEVTAARPHDPSSGVYTLYDSLTPADVPTATFAWLDVSGDADAVWDLGGDFIEDGDLSPSFDIGFIFPFYDNLYTNFRISEKGYLIFEEDGVNVGGQGLPTEIPDSSLGTGDGANNFIAPFAGDLFGYPNVSNVYIRRDSSPRRAIIQFQNVVWCCGQNNPRTFQVILYPDGSIDMQYLKITNFPGTLDSGKVVRVGLENLDGSAGDVYTQGLFSPDDGTLWQDNLAIRYERSLSEAMVIFLPDNRTVWDDPGVTIGVTPRLYFLAEPTETADFDLMTSTLEVSSALALSEWDSNITFPASVTDLTGTFSETVQFDLTVPVSAALNDVATVTFVAASAAPLVSDTFTVVYGPAQRDLQIEKTLDPSIPPAEGGALRYRLDITNTDYNNSGRPGQARGVEVGDLLPGGIDYEACSRPNGQSCNGIITSTVGTQTLVTWDVGTLSPDENRTVYLELRNSNPGGTLVNNTAGITLTDGIEIGYPDRNLDSDSLTVADTVQSQLNVGKDYPYPFNGRNFIGSGQVIPFDIFYYNDGREGNIGNAPVTATLEDVIPEGTTLDRVTEGADYNGPQLFPTISGPMSRTLTFSDLEVDNGSWNQDRIRIWVNVPQTMPVGTLLTNVVTIDDSVSDDEATEVVEIASNAADPFVQKGPSRDENGDLIQPEPGLDYTYWITYGNRSVLTEATNFVLSDTLPAEVSFVDASRGLYLTGPFVSMISGRTVVTWSADTLPRGATGQVLIVVNVGTDVPKGASLVNEVAIDYDGLFDPSDESDDTDVITVEVASDINGSAKLVDDPTPNPGQTVIYTVLVSNTGPATPFTVTDVLPAALTYVDSPPASATSGSVNVSNGTISWTGGTVAENSQETLTFRATITDSAVAEDIIRNTAQIEGAGVSLERSINVVVSTESSGGMIYLPIIRK